MSLVSKLMLSTVVANIQFYELLVTKFCLQENLWQNFVSKIFCFRRQRSNDATNISKMIEQLETILRKRNYSRPSLITSRKHWVLSLVSLLFTCGWKFEIATILKIFSVVDETVRSPDFNIDSDLSSSEEDEVENPIRPNSLSSWCQNFLIIRCWIISLNNKPRVLLQ